MFFPVWPFRKLSINIRIKKSVTALCQKGEWQQQQACLSIDYGYRKESNSSITSGKSIFIVYIVYIDKFFW